MKNIVLITFLIVSLHSFYSHGFEPGLEIQSIIFNNVALCVKEVDNFDVPFLNFSNKCQNKEGVTDEHQYYEQKCYISVLNKNSQKKILDAQIRFSADIQFDGKNDLDTKFDCQHVIEYASNALTQSAFSMTVWTPSTQD